MSLLSEGKAALLLLAGGQGTRLSATQPKGMYDIGLESKTTLFQLQALRFLKIQQLAKKNLFWYIMTSSFTYEETKIYFEDENYFGVDKEYIVFFSQDNLPCLDLNGKIILDSPSKVSFAPNGNGGMYTALNNKGILKHMKDHGIEYVHLYCVDNVLVKILDPVFIGYADNNQSDFVAKVVPKSSWNESVGVFALKNGKLSVVEYSEISEEMAKKTKNDQLVYNHSNIVMFIYRLDFLELCSKVCENDPEFHIAKKKITFANDQGKTETPTKENGYKLELFNFDLVKYSKNPAILIVDRQNEFSPLKNAPGALKDSPETCRDDLSKFNIRRLQKVLAHIEGDGICEISPLLDDKDLEIFKGKTVKLPCYLKNE